VAIRLFGSLDEAFAEADIEVSPWRWAESKVIAELRAWYDSGHRLAEQSTK
jgi:hypothetical protein